MPALSLAAPAAPGLSGLRLLRKAAGDATLFLHDRGGAVATVAVDAHGADLGPIEVAHGAVAALRTGTSCVVYGPREEIERALGPEAAGLELVDAPVAITNAEEPARAARAKPDASIVQAARALADGKAEAVVSAGSTGAALAAALLYVKRLPGVFRPAIAVPVPTPAGRVLLLDAGANVEVRPEHLVQFAYMGAAFSERVLGVERPRVALLSVGAERGKGTAAVVAAHEQLSAASGLEFIGNVEGDDVPTGKADVVVTDGFTGNVALKLMEGTARSVVTAVRDAARSGPFAMLGGMLLRPKLSRLRERLDPEAVGGAYLLGLRGLVVICHGRSTRHAIANAIAFAERGVEQRAIEKTAAALAESPVSRRQPASVPADTVKISP